MDGAEGGALGVASWDGAGVLGAVERSGFGDPAPVFVSPLVLPGAAGLPLVPFVPLDLELGVELVVVAELELASVDSALFVPAVE